MGWESSTQIKQLGVLGAWAELGAGVGRRRASMASPMVLLLAVPGRLFCFGSLMVLGVARCYLWLFSLYINIKMKKNGC